jgi:hypothetical protein
MTNAKATTDLGYWVVFYIKFSWDCPFKIEIGKTASSSIRLEPIPREWILRRYQILRPEGWYDRKSSEWGNKPVLSMKGIIIAYFT